MAIFRFLPRSAAKLLRATSLAGLACCMPAQANDSPRLQNIGLTAEDAKTAVAGKEAKAGSIKPQLASPRTGLLMRCWNYGRLVYESPVSGFAASSPSGNVVTMPGSPQKQILDMRSGLCVIE